ncbi:MAG: HD domain-containing phosphohydrolase [Candidatus Caenarcaniphilales bacterium]|nr:HD domain-containing phosphohydrolase [Candidatus Caenarcaniphilales bacterium]
MSQVLIDLSQDSKLPAAWYHIGSQKMLDEIIEDIPVKEVFLPQILTCLEQIHNLIKATSTHNLPTGLHLGRVGRLGALIAQKAGLEWKERLECLYGGWIHDVGKIYIPEHVLNKPGRLTPEEYELIKGHVSYGCELLKDYPHLQPFVDPVKYHHERWDGNGYPHGLKGLDIPVTGRVIALADAYDAITSFRPYPPYQRTHEEAIIEIKRCGGAHFDPYLAEVFCKIPQNEIENTL